MAKVVAKTKIKKKKWFPVHAPKLFGEAFMGEAYASEAEDLIGRPVSVNMMNVTGDPKKQSINAHFQIREVKEGKCKTYVKGFEISPSFLKRFIRRGREKVADSIILQTKDNLRVRVKPLMITNSNTVNSVLTKLRLGARKALAEEFSKNTFSEIIYSIVRNDLQRRMKEILTKTYPLRNFEIRVLKLLEEDKIPEDKEMTPPKREERKVVKKEEKPVKEEKNEEKPEPKKEEKTEKPKEEKAEEPKAKKTEKEVKEKPAAEEKPKKVAKKTSKK